MDRPLQPLEVLHHRFKAKRVCDLIVLASLCVGTLWYGAQPAAAVQTSTWDPPEQDESASQSNGLHPCCCSVGGLASSCDEPAVQHKDEVPPALGPRHHRELCLLQFHSHPRGGAGEQPSPFPALSMLRRSACRTDRGHATKRSERAPSTGTLLAAHGVWQAVLPPAALAGPSRMPRAPDAVICCWSP